MKITELLGMQKKFVIPVYQRPYSWKLANCKQLLDDLKAVREYERPSHFFGSIVFIEQADSWCDDYLIIDGQQRLTTVSLLLLAIRDYVRDHKELGVSVTDDEVNERYLIDKFAHAEKKLKLKLVKGDDTAYNNLIERLTPEEGTNVTANYQFFRKELAKMTAEKIEGIYASIRNLDVVGISLNEKAGDDPQLIFESLNSTGLGLEEIDKIRNYVLMRVKADEQKTFYTEYWQKLESECPRNELNTFVRYYLAVKTRQLANEKKLYFEYKSYANSSGQTTESILGDMLSYVDLYALATAPEDKNTKIAKTLARIKTLSMKLTVPIIMDLLMAHQEKEMTEEETIKALELVENFIVRRAICGLPTYSLTKLFVQLGNDVAKERKEEGCDYYTAFEHQISNKGGKSRFPDNREFAACFPKYDIYNSHSNRKYILERLENHDRKETSNMEGLTIEHIMPQMLTAEWKEMLGEDYDETHRTYLHTIGNITLTGYNSNYSNHPFREKRDMENGFAHSHLRLNEYVKKQDTWGEEQIVERANMLYERAEQIWWMPECAQTGAGEWVDLEDDTDLTNRKVTKVVMFNSQEQATDNTIEAYVLIHTKLYELDSVAYHANGIKWFATSPEGLLRPRKIGDNAYIEANKSNSDKIRYLREIAELMALDPGDIRLYVVTVRQQ